MKQKYQKPSCHDFRFLWYNNYVTEKGFTMLEKSGSIVLTKEDLDDLRLGLVSERVKSSWGLTLEQLQEIVSNNNYTIITS